MQAKTPAILALTVLSVALAGCNRDKQDDASATTAPAATAPAIDEYATPPEPVPATDSPSNGSYTLDKLVVGGKGDTTYLTDSKGRPLYVMDDDDAAKCVGDCLTTWRAVVGPPPVIDLPDVPASAITTVTRSDGTTQVAYYGHPLYYYDDGTPQLQEVSVVAEESPWGTWYLVRPNGETIKLKEGVPTTSSPTAAGADARDLPTQSPGGKPGEQD